MDITKEEEKIIENICSGMCTFFEKKGMNAAVSLQVVLPKEDGAFSNSGTTFMSNAMTGTQMCAAINNISLSMNKIYQNTHGI